MTAAGFFVWMAVLSSTLYSALPSCSGGGGFNLFTGGSSNPQITTTPSVGFGDFNAVPTAPAAPVHFNSFANPSLSDSSQSEGFGCFVSNDTNAARDFPVSFGGNSSSDLLGDFDSVQVTAALVELDHIRMPMTLVTRARKD